MASETESLASLFCQATSHVVVNALAPRKTGAFTTFARQSRYSRSPSINCREPNANRFRCVVTTWFVKHRNAEPSHLPSKRHDGLTLAAMDVEHAVEA